MEIKLIVLAYLICAAIGAAQRRRYLYHQQRWGLDSNSKRNIWLEDVLHNGKLLSLAVLLTALLVGVFTGWQTGSWWPLFGRVLIWPGVFFCISYTVGDIFWKDYWDGKAVEKYSFPQTDLTKPITEVK